MPRVERTSRTQLWLEGLGDWSWPGRGGAAEVLPPPWIPALPPRLEPAAALAGAGSWAERAPQRRRGRLWLILGLVALAAAVPVLAVPHLGERLGLVGPPAEVVPATALEAPPTVLAPLPALVPVHGDPGGSVVEHASFYSASLGSEGSFFVYLPAGYRTAVRRYPVLYMLHGRDGHAEAFLEMGIQASLDGLIATPGDRADDRRDGPGRSGPEQLAGPRHAPQRDLRGGSPGNGRPHAPDDPGPLWPGDRGQLDGRLRGDERGAVESRSGSRSWRAGSGSSTTSTNRSTTTAR